MSPTIFAPGTSAAKSRFTRSGIGRPGPVSWPAAATAAAGGQAQLPHEPADQLRAGHGALPGQLPRDPPVPVGGIRIVEDPPDDQREFLPPFCGAAFRA
jgi:hypothetical protein